MIHLINETARMCWSRLGAGTVVIDFKTWFGRNELLPADCNGIWSIVRHTLALNLLDVC